MPDKRPHFGLRGWSGRESPVMSDGAKFLLEVAAVIAIPFIIVWVFGAFLTWDAGWAFEDMEARVRYILSVLAFGYVALCIVAT